MARSINTNLYDVLQNTETEFPSTSVERFRSET